MPVAGFEVDPLGVGEQLAWLWRRLLCRPSCIVCRRGFAPVPAPANGEIGMTLTASLGVHFKCPGCAAAFHGRCADSLGSGRETPGTVRATCPRCRRLFEQVTGYVVGRQSAIDG